MKFGRFFVTVVMIVGIVAIEMATISSRAAKPEDAHKVLVQEGNDKIQEMLELRTEFKSRFGMTTAAKFNFKRLSKKDRHELDGKLAHFMLLVNRVLEIDTLKNITIEHRDLLLSERNNIEAFQHALESFEKTYGVNFSPKTDELEIHNLRSANDVDHDSEI